MELQKIETTEGPPAPVQQITIEDAESGLTTAQERIAIPLWCGCSLPRGRIEDQELRRAGFDRVAVARICGGNGIVDRKLGRDKVKAPALWVEAMVRAPNAVWIGGSASKLSADLSAITDSVPSRFELKARPAAVGQTPADWTISVRQVSTSICSGCVS